MVPAAQEGRKRHYLHLIAGEVSACVLLALFFLLIGSASIASATDYPRTVSQYTHQRWSAESEAPGPIFQVRQSRDGYLWLAAGDGVFRFDGASFERIDPSPALPNLQSATVVLPTRNGDVWTNYARSGRFAVYRGGRLQQVPSPEHRPGEQVLDMAETADGAIWALVQGEARGPLRYFNGRWKRFSSADGLPHDAPTAMLVASDGSLWISFLQSIVRLVPGAARFTTVRQTRGALGKILQDAAGRIWFAERRGLYAITGPGGRGDAPAVRYPYQTATPGINDRPMFDRAGNFWTALQFGGVKRVPLPDPRGASSAAEAVARVETLGKSDGLTSDITMGIFEDQESNIWIATEVGLDKFRPASIRVERLLNSPPLRGDVLLSARDGTVYIAEANTLFRVQPHKNPVPILRGLREPEAMCEAPDGAIWVLFNDRMLSWKDGRTSTFPRPQSQFAIQGCAFDRGANLWATAFSSGIFRFRHGKWERIFGPGDPDNFSPSLLVRDPHDNLITLWSPRRFASFDASRSRVFAPVDGKWEFRALHYATRGGLLAGGEFGLARVAAGRMQILSQRQGAFLGRVVGILEDPDGKTWLANQEQIASLQTSDLAQAFANPLHFIKRSLLTSDDGLPDRIYANGASVVRGGDGRIWVGTLAGSVWFDPKRILRNATLPPVAIASLRLGDQLYRDPASLTLPAAPATVEINYAALSFANPKHVKFRYMLQGYDRNWIDPGRRRQVFYTSLSPGKYRFVVSAANNEGAWNGAGASLDFEIPPTFFQSWLFLGLCILSGAAILWLLYRYRVAQVTSRVRSQLEARLGERQRIARELHDTLLQGVQGLVLRFQTVMEALPANEAARCQLNAALEKAEAAIEQGRDRVQDLRSDRDAVDLPVMIERLSRRTDWQFSTAFTVDGNPSPVHAHIAHELESITAEALNNVAKHAQASKVDMKLSFYARYLTIEIRDNGIGIADSDLCANGRERHYGILGMRERCARMGATLSISSECGLGTVVSARVAARRAFVRESRWWRSSHQDLHARAQTKYAPWSNGPTDKEPRYEYLWRTYFPFK